MVMGFCQIKHKKFILLSVLHKDSSPTYHQIEMTQRDKTEIILFLMSPERSPLPVVKFSKY